MYERVVIPTDGSDVSLQGVKEGLEAAEAYGIPALAIYVIPPSALSGLGSRHRFEDYDMDMVEILKEQEKKRGEKNLKKVKKRADKLGVELETMIDEGVPYERIAAEAGEGDIIYICSHGRSGIKSLFLGSTTERLLKKTKATVAVVKAK